LVALRTLVARFLLPWSGLTHFILAAGSVPFLWRHGLRGPAIGWAAWLLILLWAVRPTAEPPLAPSLYTMVASAVLLLAVPLWTALSLGRYVRGASKQTA
jgi:hypothetical protein